MAASSKTKKAIHTKFRIRSEAPLWWFNKSSDLRICAGVLWLGQSADWSAKIERELNLGGDSSVALAVESVYEMLWGMSLEVLFKAVIVAKGGEPKKSHELCSLARLAGLVYSNDAVRTLDILTDSIKRAGRYPVPRKEDCLLRADDLRRAAFGSGGSLSDWARKYDELLCWRSLDRIWTKAAGAFGKHAARVGRNE
jgi:hypothetical protein